jgi:enediyne biosynthesis protein E3
VGSFWSHVRKAVFGISGREVTFARRGFVTAAPGARQRLEAIGETFLAGYHAALAESEPHGLAARLDQIECLSRGFAYEGAGMALSLQDRLIPGRRDRLPRFLAGPGAAYSYMVHVGVGWAAARLGWGEGVWRSLDPLLRWLALDGYGFHEGYFHWRRFVAAGAAPRFAGYSRRVFDQGLGRSLWFVYGADPRAVSRAVGRLAPDRRPDLWSGIGLACAYAGGAEPDAVRELTAVATPFRPHLAQGAAFAAKARARAGNPADHTEQVCRLVCGLPADQAARLTDTALAGLPADGTEPAYEVWRTRVQECFARPAVALT